jgi:hypothetical protein
VATTDLLLLSSTDLKVDNSNLTGIKTKNDSSSALEAKQLYIDKPKNDSETKSE